MLSRFGAWSAIAILGAVMLAGCGKETVKEMVPPTVTRVPVTYVVPTAGPATPTVASTAVASTAAPAASAPATGGPVLNLEMVDISFSPTTLTAPANTDVTIHITNNGATAHNFSIDELKINTGDVAAGAAIDVKINAPAGKYTYYCDIPGHRAAGMEGVLTLT